jgi:hypothetical protein
MICSKNIVRGINSKRVRWKGHVARTGENKNAYKILIENPEEERPLARPKHR